MFNEASTYHFPCDFNLPNKTRSCWISLKIFYQNFIYFFLCSLILVKVDGLWGAHKWSPWCCSQPVGMYISRGVSKCCMKFLYLFIKLLQRRDITRFLTKQKIYLFRHSAGVIFQTYNIHLNVSVGVQVKKLEYDLSPKLSLKPFFSSPCHVTQVHTSAK